MSVEPRALRGARVLVIGAGGLGSPAAMALVRAGVGTIGIADDDVVEVSNLHRQILFGDGDVGRGKTEAAEAALRAWARPAEVTIERHDTRLLPHNATEMVAAYDVVVEGSDNFPTKFLASDAARIARRPIVHAAAVRWHGTALCVSADGGPCYRCLFEDVPRENVPNCAEAGVIGPMVGVIAAVQVDLALDVLTGRDVFGTLVTFDAKTMTARRRSLRPRRDCPSCGDHRTIHGIEMSRYLPASCDS